MKFAQRQKIDIMTTYYTEIIRRQEKLNKLNRLS